MNFEDKVERGYKLLTDEELCQILTGINHWGGRCPAPLL